MDTIFLCVSAGNGPEECAHAAALTVQVLQQETQNHPETDIKVELIETEPSAIKGNIRSALLAIEGNGARSIAASWEGSVQWIWRSTYRPGHKRKNWFVSVKPYIVADRDGAFSPGDVRFETMRSGGPGGQHVNKTETAVRAIHVPSGKSAVARGERSRLINKKLALARLAALFAGEQADKEKQSRSALRHSHWELERGRAVRVYDGETMQLIRKQNNDS